MSGPVLALDTSAAHCAAALLGARDELVVRVEDMARGQAERLVPMVEDMLAGARTDWQDLAAIAVCTGPGNFTGIRISVALARGLALALNIPAVGVSVFEAAGRGASVPHLATAPGPRNQIYIQRARVSGTDAPQLIGASELPEISGPVLPRPDAGDLVEAIARIGRDRMADDPPRPAPLYVKPADAAPASDPPPVILK